MNGGGKKFRTRIPLPKIEDQEGLRPIGARALKSLRDSYRAHFPESQVLDLFAGQGRLGLAALEEGATHVTFVEKDRKQGQNLARLISDRRLAAELFLQDALVFLNSAIADKRSYDVIFADPPFALWSTDFEKKLLSGLRGVMDEDSISLVKIPKAMVPSSAILGLRVLKSAVFGESKVVSFECEE